MSGRTRTPYKPTNVSSLYGIYLEIPVFLHLHVHFPQHFSVFRMQKLDYIDN